MKRNYFQLDVSGKTADLDIYGDITSWPWMESDVSSYTLSRMLAELDPEVTQINVNINSYGGEVSEGLAIYNALKRHPAQICTRVDGFACSIASVIFMAGDVRCMADASLLMVHNAWTYGSGDAQALRKLADDMETITQASKAAYLSCISITDEELTALMDAETWITPENALAWGFATEGELSEESALPSQCARRAAFQAICQAAGDDQDDDPDDEDEAGDSDQTGSADDADDASTDEDDGDDGDDSDDPNDGDDSDDPDLDDPDDDDDTSKQRAALAAFFNQLTI